MAEIQEHSLRVMAFSFYNNGPYLSLGSMNSVNVKVIHMGGNGPTVLIKKFKDTRSFLSHNGAMFIFLVIMHCMLIINTLSICYVIKQSDG